MIGILAGVNMPNNCIFKEDCEFAPDIMQWRSLCHHWITINPDTICYKKEANPCPTCLRIAAQIAKDAEALEKR